MEEIKKYAALEIASSTVRLVLGYTFNNRVYVLHAVEKKVKALDKGKITESDSLTNAIKELADTVFKQLNYRIEEVLVSIPPVNYNVINDQDTQCNVVSQDRVIAQIDINNCISQLENTSVNPNEQIIDVIPKYFYLNDEKKPLVNPPLGKISRVLKMNAIIFTLEKQTINDYQRVINNAGLKILKLVVSNYAASLYFNDLEEVIELKKNYFLLDMGGSITSLSYINENTIISKIACISFGGDKINENIAAKFGISYRDAKRIKERYGLDHDMTFKVPLVGNVTLDSLHLVIDESLQGVISRIKEKCDLEENKLSLKNIPVVVTGGSGKLYGIKELLKEKLAREVLIIPPYTFGARDQAYVNCLGLLRYADKYIIKMAGEELKASPLSRLKEENGNKNQTISSYDINEDL